MCGTATSSGSATTSTGCSTARASCGSTPGIRKDELAEITKRCVAMSQLRESFVNLTVTRGYGKRKGEKDLSKLTHQVYIYAIPYLWAFPPHEQIFGTTAIVPRHVRRAGRNTVDPTIKNYQWGDLTAASFEAKDRGARTAILMDADNCVAEGPGLQRGDRQGRQDRVAVTKCACRASPARRCSNSPTPWASRRRCATSPATSCMTPTS